MKTIKHFLAAAAVVPALAGAPLVAAEPADAIVVTAQEQEKRVKEARDFVGEVAPMTHEQYARYTGPVCPAVLGLDAASRHAVEKRVREVAKEIGPGAKEGDCDINLLVIVTPDPRKLFASFAEERDGLLAGLDADRKKELASSTDPVISWASTALRSRSGYTLSEDLDRPDANSYSNFLRVDTASIAGKQSRRHIDGVVVLVDRDALEGRPLVQLADHVAIRALMNARTPAARSIETVLHAFSPHDADAPTSVTEADYVMVKALYARKGTDTALNERSRIARAMTDPEKYLPAER